MVQISEKQRTALENMENMIWVFNHRENFNTYDEVQEYFDTLKKEIKKQMNFKKALVTWKVAEWMKKKREKTIERLQDPWKLREYAIFYYTKYFPSTEKLRRKLLEKNKDKELVNTIIEGLWSLINETTLLENKILNLLSIGKNYNYIKNSLIQKWFKKDEIIELLEKNTKEDVSLLSYNKVKNKIISLVKSGKSMQYIKQKFVENDNDQKLIDDILSELYEEEDPELTIIENLVKEYYEKWMDKNKIIQKLSLKWFKYNKIKNYL